MTSQQSHATDYRSVDPTLRDATGTFVPWRQTLANATAKGALRSVLSAQFGGEEWAQSRVLDLYHDVAREDLSTALLLTQRNSAIGYLQRSLEGEGEAPAPCAAFCRTLLGRAGTELLITQGTSHISPSSVSEKGGVQAVRGHGGYTLDGTAHWVTGVTLADYVLIGARTPEGNDLLAVVEIASPQVQRVAPRALLALSESDTAALRFEHLVVPLSQIVAGPRSRLLIETEAGVERPFPPLHSSAIILGHAARTIDALGEHTGRSSEATALLGRLAERYQSIRSRLNDLACARLPGTREAFEDIRVDANLLAIQSSDILMAYSRGRGFVAGHPAEQIVRESRFFLVWGTTPRVLQKTTSALARVGDAEG